jgi:hypothetical protein
MARFDLWDKAIQEKLLDTSKSKLANWLITESYLKETAQRFIKTNSVTKFILFFKIRKIRQATLFFLIFGNII